MTPRQHEILTKLETVRHNSDGWRSSRLIGGTDKSHHAQTLTRLVQRGWVERRIRGGGAARVSYEYRIKKDGQRANEKETRP